MKIIPFLSVLLFTTQLRSQTKVLVSPIVKLPQDSFVRNNLASCLSNYIDLTNGDNKDNAFIAPKHSAHTYDLSDEVKGMCKSAQYKNDFFYKPYLNNVVQKDDSTYYIQISFIGIVDTMATLRASFSLIAHQSTQNQFSFSSPLSENTKYWKSQQVGGIKFYFKDKLNLKQAKSYSTYVANFDKKLGLDIQATEYYCCASATEALRLLGVDFKSTYVGRKTTTMTASSEKFTVVVSSQRADDLSFDPHDLWHSRLYKKASRKTVNRPVDEACAYLYGGSWGISWEDILKTFKNKVAIHKNTDWQALKENPLNFVESKEQELIADYVVNALIIQKLEKEKGFGAVWELLNCGPYEKGNDNYYTSLEKLTGISKANYNSAVWQLINKTP
jgi:hypothetical protein